MSVTGVLIEIAHTGQTFHKTFQKAALMFSIDLTSRIPIYEQICTKITDLAVTGTLSENAQLPSVRSLAKDTGVNPNTVAKAYQELERQGIIYSVPGRGSFISALDSTVFQTAALDEFDEAARSAKKHGVSAETLMEHIDMIYGIKQKGDGDSDDRA